MDLSSFIFPFSAPFWTQSNVPGKTRLQWCSFLAAQTFLLCLVRKSSCLPCGFRYFSFSCWGLKLRIFFVVSEAKTSNSIIGIHRECCPVFWHLPCPLMPSTEGAAVYAKGTSSSHGASPSAANVLLSMPHELSNETALSGTCSFSTGLKQGEPP